MTAYVALLRGINVGKANRLPMADLRAMLTELGCNEVVTLLNSGNAVFQAKTLPTAAHAKRIATAITAKFGLDIPVVVKSASEFAAVVHDNAYADTATDHSRLFAVFSNNAEGLSSLVTLTPLVVPPEEFFIGSHAAYLHCASGVLQSKAGAALLGKAGRLVTTRNWATTLKLQALVQGLA